MVSGSLPQERVAAEAEAASLADLYENAGRPDDALGVLRAALKIHRRSPILAARLARALTAYGKPAESLRVLSRVGEAGKPSHEMLAEQASALKALGQSGKALAAYERATKLYPDDVVAHHNLAASLGDLGQFEGAERAASRALAKGGKAPQTWLVYARALLGLRRLDEADRAFREAVARHPTYLEAHRELAQLIWMRTENQRAATALLDAHIVNHPNVPDLFALRASVLSHAGDVANAYATLTQAIRRHPEEASLHLSAAQLAARLPSGASQALQHAERALALLPGHHEAETSVIAGCLAVGDAHRAAEIASALVQRRPFDQRAIAYHATAWRLLGDPRYTQLYDYAHFVRSWQMDVPDGWSDLGSYLADLTEALAGVHAYRTHPLDQSVRHGSQAPNLLTSDNPVIRAFFQAVDGPIRRHVARLGQGGDAVRSRNTGGYRFHGAWSVRLRTGGFHTDHVHPEGWLSSACYIALPQSGAAERACKKAWIKFGQPGVPTTPALEAEHFIEPQPGMLVLFPSYMWHGTVPFDTKGLRLSVAFDLLPRA